MPYNIPKMAANKNTSMKEIMMVVHPLFAFLHVYASKMKPP